MKTMTHRHPSWKTAAPGLLALALAIGWAGRERAFARERAERLRSATVTLDEVKMKAFAADGKAVGSVGVYLEGDTPASRKFVAGRFVLEPGKTPHPPHTHPQEGGLIVECGHGVMPRSCFITSSGPPRAVNKRPRRARTGPDSATA